MAAVVGSHAVTICNDNEKPRHDEAVWWQTEWERLVLVQESWRFSAKNET